jgi:hypothetical protein
MNQFLNGTYLPDNRKWIIFDPNSDMDYFTIIQHWMGSDFFSKENDYHTHKETIHENGDYSEAIKSLLEERLSQTKIAILLITANSLKNPWTRWEINTVIEKKIYIIGIIIQENLELFDILNQHENKKIIDFNEITFKKEMNTVFNSGN